ncbi:MAG: hypothetical protein H3C31_11485 [Brumimicrobium sp.]|nr:hypothetical protein [Brumimicrobium sp.]
MKNLILYLILSLFIWTSCTQSKKEIDIPNYPFLQADSLMHFKVGDRFIIGDRYNSCCMSAWIQQDTVNDYVISPLFKYIETIKDIADSDCDGCSDYYYSVYECTQPGIDTLHYLELAMSDLVNVSEAIKFNNGTLDMTQFIILHRGDFDEAFMEEYTFIDSLGNKDERKLVFSQEAMNYKINYLISVSK